LVFLDTGETGFSHAVASPGQGFWGVDKDVRILAPISQHIRQRTGRWNFPKLYHGVKAKEPPLRALFNICNRMDGLYFNGIVLISLRFEPGTLSFKIPAKTAVHCTCRAYAATAWYHKV